MQVLVIANPAAGAGRAGRATDALVRALRARGHGVELCTTRAAGDAGRLAAAREGAVSCIVAAGGDGTLAEVLSGLADPGATPLVPMAHGTANMMARALGIPRDPARLAQVIEAGAVHRIDLGRARFGVCPHPPGAAGSGEAIRFLSVAGVGFDAWVTRTIARTRRGRLGYRGYARPIASTLLRYRPPRLAVQLDGGPRRECAFLVVGKLSNYGGILHVTPDARPEDGRLHACLFRRASFADLVRYVLPALRGRLADLRDVTVLPVCHVSVSAEEPVPVQLDGDYRGTTPVTLALSPGVVPVLMGAEAAGSGASR